MSEKKLLDNEKKKEILKEILAQAKKEPNIEAAKQRLQKVFETIDPIEISFVEQELVKEGLSWRDIYRMCDVHFDLVKDIIIPMEELRNLPNGHPLSILIWENTEILKDNEKLNILFRIVKNEPDALNDIISYLDKLYVGLKRHYMKNQFLIFPYLEKRGVTAVSRVLWMKDDMLLNSIKKLKGEILSLENKKGIPEEIVAMGFKVVNEVRDIVSREHNILYPTMFSLLSDGEWLAILKEMDKFGYHGDLVPDKEWMPDPDIEPIYPFMMDPDSLRDAPKSGNIPEETLQMLKKAKVDDYRLVRDDDIELEAGYVNREELNAILNTVPFELTFIDKDFRTRFFNKLDGEQIFVRTKTVLGRPVKLCHPPISEELVQQVIREIRNGKEKVDFWIDAMGKKILIQFFGVRNKNGELLGILEVVQDITEIKNLKGEKKSVH
ncbi:MAG: DUF438 domain-containing protein [Candidatus Njordarchaeia archaeon]